MDPISAIANAAGSLFGAIGNIFTSGNQVDIERAKVDKAQKELEIAQTNGENLVLVEALKLKTTEANTNLLAATSEQKGKNIKTGLYSLVAAIFGFFIYKIVVKSTPEAGSGNNAYDNQVIQPQYQNVRL
jgi:hypothetical protein